MAHEALVELAKNKPLSIVGPVEAIPVLADVSVLVNGLTMAGKVVDRGVLDQIELAGCMQQFQIAFGIRSGLIARQSSLSHRRGLLLADLYSQLQVGVEADSSL